MINTKGLTAQLENIGKTTFTPAILADLEKAGQELKVLNMEMVGRVTPALNDVSKILSKGTADLNKLTASLEITANSPLAKAVSNLAGISENLKSSLPRSGVELNNGLKGLSSALSDFPKEAEVALATALPAATTAVANLQTKIPGIQKSLSEVTEGLPIAAEKLIPQLEASASTALKAISGSAVKASFNNIALTLPTPVAVAETVNAISVATRNIDPAIKAVTSIDIKATMTKQLDGIKGDLGAITSLLGEAGSVASSLSDALNSFDLPDLSLPDIGDVLGNKLTNTISDITAELNANIGGLILGITGSPILDVLHKVNNTLSIVGGTLGISLNLPNIDGILGNVVRELTNGTALSALKILQDLPNIGIDIAADLNGFEIKMQSLKDQFGSASAMLPSGIQSTRPQSQVTSLSRTQTVVNSAEEVHTEITSAEKTPKEMEVSWTETYKNEVVNRDNIRPKDHYHYIVQPNGMIQRGKQVGDDRTIRVVVVAGYNVDRGEEGELTGDSVTNSQKLAVRLLMEQAVRATPGIRVYGKGESVDLPGGRGGRTAEPGIDIDAMRKSIDGSGSAPIGTPAVTSTAGLPIGPRVTYLGGVAKFRRTRSRPELINTDLMKILEQAANDADVYLTIHSGGNSWTMDQYLQYPGPKEKRGPAYYINPGPNERLVRYGSRRHDNGRAADFRVSADSSRKITLNPSVSANPDPRIIKLLISARSQGITGMGAGPKYMVPLIHLDIKGGGRWGSDHTRGTAPEWLKKI